METAGKPSEQPTDRGTFNQFRVSTQNRTERLREGPEIGGSLPRARQIFWWWWNRTAHLCLVHRQKTPRAPVWVYALSYSYLATNPSNDCALSDTTAAITRPLKGWGQAITDRITTFLHIISSMSEKVILACGKSERADVTLRRERARTTENSLQRQEVTSWTFCAAFIQTMLKELCKNCHFE